MIKLKKSRVKLFLQKVTSLFLIFQLTFFQSLALFLPTAIQAQTTTTSSVSYEAESHQLVIDSTGKAGDDYRLYFQHDNQTEAVVGKLGNDDEKIYLGTCSTTDCTPADTERLVLKLVGSEVNTQRLIIASDKVEIDQSYVGVDSADAELTEVETNWLVGKTDAGWLINEDGSYTFETVSLNEVYRAPQNDQVSVTFASLPDETGSLTIKEVQLTEEQVQELGALSDVAYDITSSMTDGSFTYDLTLSNPQPEQESQVKYSEDGTSFEDAEGETKGNQVVTIKGLNHFTVFVVTGSSFTPDSSTIFTVDNGDADYGEPSGSWSNSGSSCSSVAIDGDGRFSSDLSAQADWDFTVPVDGVYKIYAHWVSYSSQATMAEYSLFEDGDLVFIDQISQVGPNCVASDWQLLADELSTDNEFSLNAGNSYKVTLSQPLASGNLYADAIKVALIEGTNEVWVDDDWGSVGLGDLVTGPSGDLVFGHNAFAIIQEGIDQVADNAIIHVMPGTYDESIIIDKPLNVRGFNADIDPNVVARASEAIINGQSSVAVKIAADDVTINGFTITNSVGSDGLAITNNNNILVENNIITNLNSASSTAYGITIAPSTTDISQITIQNNLISDIHYTGSLTSGFSVAGIAAGWSDNTYTISDLNIQNNALANITSNTSPWKVGHGAYGILLNNGSKGLGGSTITPQITGNTITSLEGLWSHAIGLEGPTPNAVVTGNTISNIVDHKNPSDSAGVFFETNPDADSVLVNHNSFATSIGWGVAMHPDLMTSNPSILINARNNWWGDATGPLDTINTDGSIPSDNLSGLGTGVFGKVDYSQWAVNSSFTFDAPVNLGWNIRSKSPNPGDRSVDLACGATTNADYPTYNNGKVSQNWESLTAPTNVKYQRQYMSPGSNSWSTDGTAYTNGYIPFSTFGSAVGTEGEWNSRVRAWVDVNGNNSYDDDIDSVSGWSNECSVIYDRAAPIITLDLPVNDSLHVGNIDLKATCDEECDYINFWWREEGQAYSNVSPDRRYHYEHANGTVFEWSLDSLNAERWGGDPSYVMADGTYYLYAAGKDAAGNWAKTSEVKIVVDNTVPDLTVDSIKYANGTVESGKFVTNYNTPVILGTTSGDVSVVNLTVNSHTYPAILTGTDWEADITDVITDGLYTMTVEAIDFAGNSTTKTQEIRIDTSAPSAVYKQYDGTTEVTGTLAYVNDLSRLSFTGEYADNDPSANLYWDSYVIFEAQDDGSFGFSRNGKQSFCSWRSTPNLVDISGGNTFSLTTKELFTNCESSLADGEYYMTHQVYDTATRKDIPSINQFRDVLGLHFAIDTALPTSAITLPTNDGDSSVVYDNSWNGSIVGTAIDAGTVVSGIARVDLSIKRDSDGKYWTGSDWTGTDETTRVTATGTSDWTYDLSSPAEDTYAIVSHAVDKAGNVENSYSLTIVFDKTIPEVTLTINPIDPDGSNGWYKTNPEIALVATDDNDPNHGFKQLEYQWNSQTGTWTTTTNTTVSFNPPGEGHNILYYRALDKAGNYSEIGIKNVRYDNTPLEEGPLNVSVSPNPTSGSTAIVTWDAASDGITIDKYEITWQLDGTDTQYSKTVNSTTFETEIDQLSEGKWNVKVKAFDGVGNSKEANTELIVDRSAPDAPVLAITGTGVGTASLSWNAVDGAQEYLIFYGTTSGDYIYGANVGGVTSYTVQGLGAGDYYFVVRAKDAAHNQSANSNEVNSGTIAGAIGAAPGAPAQGFIPAGEVQGATTEESPVVGSEETQLEGEIMGASDATSWLKYNLPWIILVIQALAILLADYLKRRDEGYLKHLFALATTVAAIMLFKWLVDSSIYAQGSAMGLVAHWFIGISIVVTMLVKAVNYAFIEDATT